jgi:cytochrome c oxidase subunit 2
MFMQKIRFWRLFAFLVAVMLAACSSTDNSWKNLPPGNAANGATLFTQSINGAPACATCHTTDGSPLTGPSFKGFSTTAGTRISGYTAQQYAYESITKPAAFVVSGYSNVMFGQYSQSLSQQQIADLIAYLLTL